MREIWKDIEGYEGLYQISNLGRVKSLARKTNNQYCKQDTIMKIHLDKDGYQKVGLYKDRKQKVFSIHRLVAEAFIPNTNNCPVVNHKDENKENNRVENLEWCTVLYNNLYNNKMEKLAEARWRKVGQYDLDNNLIKIWDSMKEAQETLHLPQGMWNVCNGNRKTCGGFKWKYIREDELYEGNL